MASTTLCLLLLAVSNLERQVSDTGPNASMLGDVLFVVNRDTLATQAVDALTRSEVLKGRVETLQGRGSCRGSKAERHAQRQPCRDVCAANPAKELGEEGPEEATALQKGRIAGTKGRVIVATIQTLIALGLTRFRGGEDGGEVEEEDQGLSGVGLGARLLEPSVVIIDEAHCALADSYACLTRAFPKAFLLGLTATPFRLRPDEHLAKVTTAMVPADAIPALKSHFTIRCLSGSRP